MNILEVKNLKNYFHTRDGIVKAVDDVSFHVAKGETLGVVGESGSGKSVTHLAYLGLLPSPPSKIESGNVHFQGKDLLHMDLESLRKLRGNKISMIFQDPMTSLNPFLSIKTQLMETILTHTNISEQDAYKKSVEGLIQVGIPAADKRIESYPHELSGGMRQRVMIAMALLNNPELLIADEPTTALDVTIQAGVLELIDNLKKQKGMSVILITHDLGVVAGLTDRIIVMYAGQIKEEASTFDIFNTPKHPYTKALLQSVPRLDTTKGNRLLSIPGLPPDLAKPPTGCRFHPRCPEKIDKCDKEEPQLKEVGNCKVSCHLY